MIENTKELENLEATKETLIEDGWECTPADEPQNMIKGYVFYKELDNGRKLAFHVKIPMYTLYTETTECESFSKYNKIFNTLKNSNFIIKSDNPRELKLGFTVIENQIDYDLIHSYYLKVGKLRSDRVCYDSEKSEDIRKFHNLNGLADRVKEIQNKKQETLSDESIDNVKQSLTDLNSGFVKFGENFDLTKQS